MYTGKCNSVWQRRIDDDMQPRIDDKSSQMKSWVCIFW